MSKSIRIIVAILLVVLNFQTTRAQKEGIERIDSLFAELPKLTEDTNKVKTLATLSYELISFDLKKGVEVGNQALKLAEELQYDYGIALSKLSLCRNYFFQSESPLVMENILEVERLFQVYNDYERLGIAYLLHCQMIMQYDRKLGQEYYNKAKSLVINIKDGHRKRMYLTWIISLSSIFDPDSLDQFRKQYKQMAMSSKSDYAKALSYLFSAEYYVSNRKLDIDSALFFRKMADTIFLKLQNTRQLASNYRWMGILYRDKGGEHNSTKRDLLLAEEYLKRSITLSEEFGVLAFIYLGYINLYQLQKDQGKTDQALLSLEKFTDNYILLTSKNNVGKVAYIDFKYQNDLNKKNLAFLEAQSKKRLTILIAVAIIVIGLILITVLIIVIWRKNLLLKRRELDHQMTTLEQKALQSMMNPHFIFNALSSIQSYLLQNKSREAGLYLSQFARLIRQNLSAINSPMVVLEEEMDRLKNYLELEQLRMSDRFNYNIEIDENVSDDEVMIPSMILQPFVENAILHGISSLDNMGEIQIVISMDSRAALTIVIEDNGISMKSSGAYSQRSEKHLHMGMEMTRKRLKVIGRKFHIETSIEITEAYPDKANPGTRVRIVVPIAYSGSKFE